VTATRLEPAIRILTLANVSGTVSLTSGTLFAGSGRVGSPGSGVDFLGTGNLEIGFLAEALRRELDDDRGTAWLPR
jgi:hypothetical protein